MVMESTTCHFCIWTTRNNYVLQHYIKWTFKTSNYDFWLTRKMYFLKYFLSNALHQQMNMKCIYALLSWNLTCTGDSFIIGYMKVHDL